jgi:HAD superfamily hydrolase (TIGR01509 family)
VRVEPISGFPGYNPANTIPYGTLIPVPVRAVIFDMDGLMLDTEPLYKIAWQRAAVECGYHISEELYFDLVGRSRADGEKILLAAFGPGFPSEAFHAACARCEAAVFAERLPSKKAGLDNLLSVLDQHRILKAVATSTERSIAAAQLAGLELLNRFAVLATGDEVANGKPAPDLFLLTARRLGVEPAECLVLEDSEAGVMAAYRAGMEVYIVPDLKPPSTAVEELTRGRFDSLMAFARCLQSRLTYRP